jgi:hypothetical protein
MPGLRLGMPAHLQTVHPVTAAALTVVGAIISNLCYSLPSPWWIGMAHVVIAVYHEQKPSILHRGIRMSMNHFSLRLLESHSINGFLCPPIMHIPSALSPAGSPALIMAAAGNMGLSGEMCAASFAACSMASISSLHCAWSKGQTTMGWRRRISRADDSFAYGRRVSDSIRPILRGNQSRALTVR